MPRPSRRRYTPFASAASAQLWVEWKSKGQLLPMLAAVLLLFMGLVVVPFVPARHLLDVAGWLAALLLMAAFLAGYRLGTSGFWSADLRLRESDAARPLSSSALATAKLQAAGLSALATWLFVVVAIPGGLAALGKLDEFASVVQPFLAGLSDRQAGSMGLLGSVGLLALLWGQLVAGLSLSLAGRGWIVNAAVAVHLATATGLFLAGRWVTAHPQDAGRVLDAISICAGSLVALKLLGSGWALMAAHRRKFWDSHALVCVLAAWSLGTACVVTLLYQLLPEEGLALTGDAGDHVRYLPIWVLACGCVLAMPLARLAAAPLAVAWNRHR